MPKENVKRIVLILHKNKGKIYERDQKKDTRTKRQIVK